MNVRPFKESRTQQNPDEALSLLCDSVQLRTRTDVPFGCYLSGGIDSSVIASIVTRHLGSPIQTFTGAFSEGGVFDDSEHADTSARFIGSQHECIRLGPKDFIDVFPKLIWHMDEPMAAEGLVPAYYVSKLARERVKVALGGQGADEIFGGYTRYYLLYLEALLGKQISGSPVNSEFTLGDIEASLSQAHAYRPLLSKLFGSNLFGSPQEKYLQMVTVNPNLSEVLSDPLTEADYSPYREFSSRFDAGKHGSLLDQVLWYEVENWLPALLHVEDRVSMAVSLESRVPFLDHRLVEFVFGLTEQQKFHQGQTKFLLRKLVRGLIPETIRLRKQKIGFPVPLNQWSQGPLHDFLRDTLLSSRSLNRGFFKKEFLKSRLKKNATFDKRLWGALCLETWAHTFLDS